MKEATPALPSPPSPFAGSEWFDPLEEAVRGRVRSFIEDLLEEELEAALGRERYQRGAISNGRRHGHRPRQLITTFGPLTLSVPRARLADEAGEQEWKSALLPAYKRLSRRAEALIAEAYLAGMNTRRVRRALAKLFEGHIGKDVVSRAWQKTRAAWQAWQERDLAGDDIAADSRRHGGQGSSGSQGHRHLAADRARHPARRPEGGARDQEHGRRERGRLAGCARRPDQPRARQTGSRHRRWRQRPRGGARQPLGRRPGAALHVHKERNLLAHAPKHLHDEIKAEFNDMMHAKTADRGPGQAQGLPGALEAALSRGRRQPGGSRRAPVHLPALPARAVALAQDHKCHRAFARGVQAPDQDPVPAALRRDRRHAVLGAPGLGSDHHAPGRWLAHPRPLTHRS